MAALLPILLAIDAIAFVIAVILAVQAQHAPGQDAAGRGMVWIFPVFLAPAPALALLLWLVGLATIATVIAALPVLLGVLALSGQGARAIRAMKQVSGTSYFPDKRARHLANAVARGNVAKLERLVAAGGGLDVTNGDDWSLLDFAIFYHPEQVATLVRIGANPDFRAPNGHAPLCSAVGYAHAGAVRALLEAGADPNVRWDGSGQPAVFNALTTVDRESFRVLAEHGADLAVRDPAGRTALMIAANSSYGRWDDAMLALDRGADPHAVAADGTTLKSILDTQWMSAEAQRDPAYLAFVARLKALGIAVERQASAA